MQQRLIELQLQRSRLRERIASQRRGLAQAGAPIAHALRFGDRLAEWAERGKRYALEHPLVVGAAIAGLVLLRPVGAARLARRGLLLWRSWTTLRAALPGFLTRRL